MRPEPRGGQAWIEALGLRPHPEGGYYQRRWRTAETVVTAGGDPLILDDTKPGLTMRLSDGKQLAPAQRELSEAEKARRYVHRWAKLGRSCYTVKDVDAAAADDQIDFFTGNARMLRDRMSRALPAWEHAMPGYHAMLGMQAFGFEEMGDYGRAEAAGKRAIEDAGTEAKDIDLVLSRKPEQ